MRPLPPVLLSCYRKWACADVVVHDNAYVWSSPDCQCFSLFFYVLSSPSWLRGCLTKPRVKWSERMLSSFADPRGWAHYTNVSDGGCCCHSFIPCHLFWLNRRRHVLHFCRQWKWSTTLLLVSLLAVSTIHTLSYWCAENNCYFTVKLWQPVNEKFTIDSPAMAYIVHAFFLAKQFEHTGLLFYGMFIQQQQRSTMWINQGNDVRLVVSKQRSEVKWSEVKWSEVKWSEVKWSEVKWMKYRL